MAKPQKGSPAEVGAAAEVKAPVQVVAPAAEEAKAAPAAPPAPEPPKAAPALQGGDDISLVAAAVGIEPAEVLSFRLYDDRVVVVTVAGQKLEAPL